MFKTKKTNGWFSALALSVGFATVLTACSQSATSNQQTQPAPPQPSAETPPAPEQAAKPAQVLRANNFSEPTNLNPNAATDIYSNNVLLQVFEGLTRINKEDKPENAIAQDIKVSDDLTTYTFTLRDAKWSNGDPVTAHDFDYAWRWVLNSKNGSEYAYMLYYIKNAEKVFKGELPAEQLGVKVIDDKTLEVKLENPTPFFLELTAFSTYYPVHSKTAKANPDWYKNAGPDFISDGPFKLADWKHKDKIVLEKNENYWDAQNVKLDKIELNMINDTNTELSMFEGGELDMAGAPVSSIPFDAMTALKEKGVLHIKPKAATYWYEFNVDKKPFNNKKIRQAFAYAIDRKSIVQNITQGGELPATAIVPPTMFPENEQGLFKDNDVETAKKLLAEGMKEEGYASVDKLPPITLSYNTDDAQAKIAQAVQDMWSKNLGVSVKLENQEWNVYYDAIKQGNYQVARMGWTGDFNDPINFLEIFKTKGGNNHTNWENKQYTELLNKSATVQDPAQRKAVLQDAEKIFIDDMPVLPFYFRGSIYTQSEKLKDVVISGMGNAQYKWAYFE
ncbi:peptide ABC transporter substrate-binding protein [Brevibacillus fluminis]|uniref:peptide ABC transporter substrate-binding protein n=1 Tax=Brevibacillus fluminis TaxID=511487 RepID=UPI003F89529B